MLVRVLKDIFGNRAERSLPSQPGASDADGAQQWLRGIVHRMFENMHNVEPDNFDANRFRGQSADMYFFQQHAEYLLFLTRNASHFYAARGLLEDETSRGLFDRLVLYRILGHMHVRLPFNTPENASQSSAAQRYWREDTADIGPFGPLAIFDIPGKERDLHIKGWKENVMWTFLYRQYYFDRDGIQIAPQAADHVVDGGGCFGDTAIHFADTVGPDGHVYVFDPMPKHCAIMGEQVAMNPELGARITIFPEGLAEHSNDVAPMPPNDVINPGARLVESAMRLATIDETVTRHDVPRVDFIKLDIEGSELGALKGGEMTLRRWRPRLAISLYHRPEDFFAIPLWLESLNLGYRMFLDHYTIHHEETVLYATA